MKKTVFVTSLITCLLCSGLAKAQTTDFIIPASAYTLSSEAGTFTDIADNPNTHKFGEDLTGGTALKDGFFVNSETAPFVTHAADSTKTDPGFALGFDFNLCGKTMTHFTICASGGIFFCADENIPQGQSQSWHAFFGWKANLQNIVSIITKDAAGTLNTAQSIAGKSPVMYLIEGESGAKVLTVQYDYAINGDEWIYQLKAYEASGNIELVVSSLATANAGGKAYRLFIGLVENGNYTITNDAFGKDNLNLQDKHFLGMTQTEAGAWSTVTPYINTSSTPDGLYVTTDNAPESGRTLTFNAPADCAAKAKKFGDDWYGFSTTDITKTTFSGKISFNKGNITPAEMTEAGTLVAVLSTSGTPDYTLANGTWYKAGDKLGDNRVLVNAKPRYNIYNDNWNGSIYDITLSANELTEATTYYLHIYAMDYRCTGAPVYSDLCNTFSFTTSISLPQTFTAGLPTTSTVPLTVQSAGNGYGVVLLKSPNTNALTLSGKLQAGDKIGDAEVLTVINSANETAFNASFEAGEGAYILAYSVKNPDAETPAYGQDCLSLPVRAAYDELPTFTFENETIPTPVQNEYGRLPFGWTRETEFAAAQRPSAFRLEKVEPMTAPSYTCLSSSYPGDGTYWSDVVTAAFALPAGIDKISATFLLIFQEAKDGAFEPGAHDMTAKDSVRIEYSVNGGAWQTALKMDGLSDDFPQLNAQKQYPLNALIRNLKPGGIVRLRYSFRAPKTDGAVYCRIVAVDIVEGKDCLAPKALQPVDSLATNERLTVSWMDDNLAPNFLVAYQAENGTDWQYKRISAGTNREIEDPISGELSGLNAGTVYNVKVATLCSSRDTSFFTEPLAVRTAFDLPYEESMAKTGNGATAQTPFDRGVKTYSGVIGRQLTETTEAGTDWNQTKTSAPDNAPIAVSVADFSSNAWLMLPALYIRSIGGLMPKSLHFTLSSFDDDKNKGVAPNSNDTELKVLVSGNGLFTQNDIVQTLEAKDLALNEATFTIDLSERTGFLQVAFVFNCPTGAQNTGNDDTWYLEIKDVLVKYDVDLCFPVENLDRSVSAHEAPLTWNASASAVEYGIFWGVNSAEGYSDSAFTTEAHYTITGLKDNTRYKAMVIAYCDEGHGFASLPAVTAFRTSLACHTPENFHVAGIQATGADFVSTSDQSDYMTQRIVYITPDKGDKTFAFIQDADTLHVRDSLTKLTAYTAMTQAVCEVDTSAMSEALHFTTTDSLAMERIAQLNGLFSVRAQDGQIAIRNLNNLLIRNVTVFNQNGAKLADFRTDSRDDLLLPIGARRMLIFVRLQTEQGVAVYKTILN